MTQNEPANVLGTVEDFEKVRIALENPNSQLRQYQIRAFGFCLCCKDVTEYYKTWGAYCYIRYCSKCNRAFYEDDKSRIQPVQTYLTGDKIPTQATERIAQLHSREQQKAFFGEKLENFIRESKARMRSEKRIIYRLAALRF